MKILIFFFSFLLIPVLVYPKSIFVSNSGLEDNSGSIINPVNSIQIAVEKLSPGDSCIIRGGVYKLPVLVNNSGTAEKPITITSFGGEKVILTGTEEIKIKGNSYKNGCIIIPTINTYSQIYIDGEFCYPAQWPNRSSDDWITKSEWGISKPGSVYRKLTDPELPEMNSVATDTKITLVQGWQYFSKLNILNQKSNSIEYSRIGSRRVNDSNLIKSDKAWVWQPYKLTGSRHLLDANNEWVQMGDTLYIFKNYFKTGDNMVVQGTIENYILKADHASHIFISGIYFKGTSAKFINCNNIVISNCHFEYTPAALVLKNPTGGGQNELINISVSKAENGGLVLQGSDNVLINSLFIDIKESAIRVDLPASGTIIKNNTILDVGHKAIHMRGRGEIAYNYVAGGGFYRNETALIQVGNPLGSGTRIHHNWVSGATSFHNMKGIGIRCDDQSRNYHVYNNVVYNCQTFGIITKGDSNYVYNNTVFTTGVADIVVPTRSEPEKLWLGRQWPLLRIQNIHSITLNNVASSITSWWPESSNVILKKSRKPSRANAPGGICENNVKPDEHDSIEDLLSYQIRANRKKQLGQDKISIQTNENMRTNSYTGAYEPGGFSWLPGCYNSVEVQRDSESTILVSLCLPPLSSQVLQAVLHGGSNQKHIIKFEINNDNWWSSATLDIKGYDSLQFITDDYGVTKKMTTNLPDSDNLKFSIPLLKHE